MRPCCQSVPVMAMEVSVLPVPSYISMSKAQPAPVVEGKASPPSRGSNNRNAHESAFF